MQLFFTTMGRASNSSGPSHELQTAIGKQPEQRLVVAIHAGSTAFVVLLACCAQLSIMQKRAQKSQRSEGHKRFPNTDAAFGSLEQAQKQFSATALGVFAGWAWLVLKTDGNLTITSTPDHVRRPRTGSSGGICIVSCTHVQMQMSTLAASKLVVRCRTTPCRLRSSASLAFQSWEGWTCGSTATT
jgi:Iron/manganese superoxide dismutases, C-terminal domain